MVTSPASSCTRWRPREHPTLRPHSMTLALVRPDLGGDAITTQPAAIEGARAEVPAVIGLHEPAFVFPNHGDHDYAKVVLDPVSLAFAREHLADVDDPLPAPACLVGAVGHGPRRAPVIAGLPGHGPDAGARRARRGAAGRDPGARRRGRPTVRARDPARRGVSCAGCDSAGCTARRQRGRRPAAVAAPGHRGGVLGR